MGKCQGLNNFEHNCISWEFSIVHAITEKFPLRLESNIQSSKMPTVCQRGTDVLHLHVINVTDLQEKLDIKHQYSINRGQKVRSMGYELHPKLFGDQYCHVTISDFQRLSY